MVYFSVIVPVYNRVAHVGRALTSCLAQTFPDFEVVVVDDGSSDGSAAAVRSFTDPRIRLIVHDRNQGRCPARNTGMANSRGEWFVFLDSDDELLPGALQTIHRDATNVAPDVNGLRYACVDENGVVSPDPPYPNDTWTYERYLQSLEESLRGRSEALPCSRASTFPQIAYPGGHAEEGVYHFDVARLGRVFVSPDAVRRYHHDAPNQITRPDLRRTLRFAPDAARNVDAVLARHGVALQRHAPTVHALRLREGALYHFMAGHRLDGLRYARRYVRRRGLSLKLALIVILGMAGGVPLALSQTLHSKVRHAGLRLR